MSSTPTWGTFWRVRAVLLGCRASSPKAGSLWREVCWAACPCLPEGARSWSHAVFDVAWHQDKRWWAQTERQEALLGRKASAVRLTELQHRLPRKAGRSAHPEVLTRPGDVALGKRLWVALLEWSGAQTLSRGALLLSPCCAPYLEALPPCWLCSFQGCGRSGPGSRAFWSHAPPRWSSPGTVALPVAPGRRHPRNSAFPSLCLQWCWLVEETS